MTTKFDGVYDAVRIVDQYPDRWHNCGNGLHFYLTVKDGQFTAMNKQHIFHIDPNGNAEFYGTMLESRGGTGPLTARVRQVWHFNDTGSDQTVQWNFGDYQESSASFTSMHETGVG